MAVREILILPDKRLRLVSDPVKTIDREIKTLVADMFETMYDAPGIGLAAIQIGVPQRVVTMDLGKRKNADSPDDSDDEDVKVKFLDLDGKAHEEEAAGLYATCIQHEIDHLNGVLFIDHISKLKRDRIVKKFSKAAKRAA